MKVKLNVDAIDPSIDSLVASELEKLGVISCLGNMIPPVLKRVVEFEHNILKPKNAVLVDEVGIEDVSTIVVDSDQYGSKHVISKEAVAQIQQYKKDRAKLYAQQLHKCLNCKQQELCFKLTTNYLKFISLEEDL